jgi:hypothetical protein
MVVTASETQRRHNGDTVMKKTEPMSRRGPFDFDIDDLLHPARAFENPQHVNDPDLTLNEKRAILSSWASDACAIEAAPELRQAPGTATPVRFDDVMDALRALDREASEHIARLRAVAACWRIASWACSGASRTTAAPAPQLTP